MANEFGRLVAVKLDVADTRPLDDAVNRSRVVVHENAHRGDPWRQDVHDPAGLLGRDPAR